MNSQSTDRLAREQLNAAWRRVGVQPANRLAGVENTRKQPSDKRGCFDDNAMDVERRILRPRSRWMKVVESDVVWPNHWNDGRIDSRQTEPIKTDEDGDDDHQKSFWNFLHANKFSGESRPLKRKAPTELGLTTTYEGILRNNEHKEKMSEMGLWWNLFTGEPAEQLMFWYYQGMSLQALTYLAKSRLQSNIKLVPGHEMEMVQNFVYARSKNPQDPIRASWWNHDAPMRLKTQAEEDATFIWSELDGSLKAHLEGRTRASGPRSRIS